MFVVNAWFDLRTGERAGLHARRQVEGESTLGELVSGHLRHEFGGPDWGLTVWTPPHPGPWPVVAADDEITAVSVGIPIGPDTRGGALGLARRLLAGVDITGEVVPPFSMIVRDRSGAVTVAQDWLGMSRLFTATEDDVLTFGTRPTLLAAFMSGGLDPDVEAWESFAASGHFGGDSSPVRGVRLLGPGEKVILEPRSGGGWTQRRTAGRTVDDVVRQGLARRNGADLADGDAAAAVDVAAEGIAAVAADTLDMFGDDFTLGLSGGKDSRVMAAAFVGGGRLPRLHTNDDASGEADTARHLVDLLRQRGLSPRHELVTVAAPKDVLRTGLRERGQHLLRQFDCQFPSSYLVRPSVGATLHPGPLDLAISGAGGEVASGYWYPRNVAKLADTTTVEAVLAVRHLGAAPQGLVTPVQLRERDRLADLLAYARGLGLAGAELSDYVYLTERMRRWCTSAYIPGLVTPFLAPAVVSASFTLTPAMKLARTLHSAVVAKFAPEWSAVPYVSGAVLPSAATRIWQGDGAATIRGLLAAPKAELAKPIRLAVVRRHLADFQWGRGMDERATSQFVYLSFADRLLRGAPPVRLRHDALGLRRLRDRLWLAREEQQGRVPTRR